MIEWILPFGFILAGLVAGLVGEKIIGKQLKEFVVQKQIPGAEILVSSLHRMIFLWCVLAGFFAAILSYSSVKPNLASTEKFTEILQQIVTIGFLFSVTLVFARLTAGFAGLLTRRTEGVSTSLISNVAKTTVIVLGTLIILQTIGVEITPIVTTLGISGLAVGLALKDTLENLFSGLYIIISKQVGSGDYVKLDGLHEGYVTDISWRSTTIKELSNNIIVVPNSKLASAIFTNYHLPGKEIIFTINAGVDYDSDLELVERVTTELAKEVMQEIAPEIVDYEPYLRFEKFSDYSIDFAVFLRVNEFFDQRIARHIFIKKLHKRYQLEGIKIPFPLRELYVPGNIPKKIALGAD